MSEAYDFFASVMRDLTERTGEDDYQLHRFMTLLKRFGPNDLLKMMVDTLHEMGDLEEVLNITEAMVRHERETKPQRSYSGNYHDFYSGSGWPGGGPRNASADDHGPNSRGFDEVITGRFRADPGFTFADFFDDDPVMRRHFEDLQRMSREHSPFRNVKTTANKMKVEKPTPGFRDFRDTELGNQTPRSPRKAR